MKAVRRSRTSLFNDVLRIFLLKKFSRVVVYCSVIKVPVVLSQATALIFYQIRFALSRTFLFFFFFRFPSRVSLTIVPLALPSVNHFLQVFFTFLAVRLPALYLVFLHDIVLLFTPILLCRFSNRFQLISEV